MFQGQRVILRAPELCDIATVVEYFNDLEVRRALNRVHPVSDLENEEWFRSLAKHRREGTQFTFLIELQRPKHFLGMCTISEINPIYRSGSLGIAISNKKYWNQGLGTEALELLLWFGFEQLNLHRIWLTVYEYNHIAKHVYEKLGFSETGRHREFIHRFGKFHDMITMDLLSDEYRRK